MIKEGACRASYLALGVTLEGDRDVLGMWFQESEGAKFWLQVLNDLKQRGVQDILIVWVDGLKGFPDAIEAVFPKTWVQTCIVHLIPHSLRYVPRREREQVARDLKPIYTAADADAFPRELRKIVYTTDEIVKAARSVVGVASGRPSPRRHARSARRSRVLAA